MNKNIVFALFGCLLFINGFAQTNEIDKFLSEIERNNIKLKAYKSYVESRQLVNKTSNNLPDPQLSAYYMPYGNNNTTDYTEFQISQSLEFPTVYSARGKWNNLKEKQLDNNYAELRQSILLKAQKLIIELVSLQNKREITAVRQDQSKKIYDQIQELFKNEQVGILDLNKSKIVWIQEQFSVEQIASEIQIITTSLEKLNGDNPIDFKEQRFEDLSLVDDLETIWKMKLEQDPTLRNLKVSEEASLQQLKLEKNKVLPNLTIGYSYQGVSGNNYAGLFGGVSIPLWNSKNKVKAAKANYKYQQTNAIAEAKTFFSEYQQQYNRYRLLLKKYNEYKLTMDSLNSEALLYKAYSLGEYSFREYYQEIQFYRVSYNKMLQMEKEVYLLKADLLKHQL
jgi:cobalt-zinc-cadmium efflux system outer membrane protein